jgi:hypothetical protein
MKNNPAKSAASFHKKNEHAHELRVLAKMTDDTIASFSMEFALDPAMPSYCGGFGVRTVARTMSGELRFSNRLTTGGP